MKMVQILVFLAVVLFAACSTATDNDHKDLPDMCVVFVGASITEAWDFDHYFSGYDFQKVIYYDWDKTQVWDQVVAYDPDIVLVKECGAYFYADGTTPLGDYENCMQTMVSLIQGIDAIPVLATTLPIDVGYGGCTQEQLDGIIEFDNWVRSYCSSNNITVMEYYNTIADGEGQLPTDCHDGDGLHPNQHGYDILSPIVIPTLESSVGVQGRSVGSIRALFN
jgi:hypothetical protein